MARQNVEKLAFNRGIVSPLALGRVDIKRIGLSASTQTNWMPRTLGPMSLRPGLEYLGSTRNNLLARHIPFVYSNDDTAIIELTDLKMRVRVNDALVTRPTVATTLTNGTFDTNLTGWADADEGAVAASIWATGGYMQLTGDGTNAALRTQTLTIASGDQNVEHALDISIDQGDILIRVGSTSGGDEYISESTLLKGSHSLAFTPTGASVYIQLFRRDDYPALVASCTLAAAGVMELAGSPVHEEHLTLIRYEQSADVIFLAASGHQHLRIERRGTTSWSIVDFVADDGPFRVANLTPVTLTASAITGTITLTASRALFKSTNVGSLFMLTSSGQAVTKTLGAADVYSDPIMVTGLTASRGVSITITGTWVATITLQRSVGDVGNWVDVESYTTNQSKVYNDSLDNQTIYYRVGIKAAAYTSGSAALEMTYAFGSITGVARVTAFTSATVVSAVVLRDLGAVTATSDWAEGAWSTRRGFPSAVVLHEGRLWWAGKDKIWGSVSDGFNSHDPDYEGDAGPINRSLGQGPVDVISWMISAYRLVVGAQASEKVVKSSALDEPITPTNYSLKDGSTFGASAVAAVKADSSVLFVDRSGVRLMELAIDTQLGGTATTDLSILVPEIGEPYITRVAIQRRTDTRVHCVRSDGKVAILVFDKAEDVKCWVLFETDGLVEDVITLPGTAGDIEDKVYYTVARTINGATYRFLEKWALISECEGGTTNKQADAFYHWTGASGTVITGLTHLVGETVVCWANGKDQGTFTVSGTGTITLPEATTAATVGLGYTATYISTKLAYAAEGGSALTQPKRVDHLGLVLHKTHSQGLRYGTDAAYLDDLPQVENGATVAADYVWDAYDQDSVPVNGTISTDSRLYLQAAAPRPCTVLAAVISMTTNDKL